MIRRDIGMRIQAEMSNGIDPELVRARSGAIFGFESRAEMSNGIYPRLVRA
jgi:hypothetical protein